MDLEGSSVQISTEHFTMYICTYLNHGMHVWYAGGPRFNPEHAQLPGIRVTGWDPGETVPVSPMGTHRNWFNMAPMKETFCKICHPDRKTGLSGKKKNVQIKTLHRCADTLNLHWSLNHWVYVSLCLLIKLIKLIAPTIPKSHEE